MPEQTERTGNNISPGALAGVVVGVVLGSVAVLPAIWILIRRRRESKRLVERFETKGRSSSSLNATHEADGRVIYPARSEIDSRRLHEAGDSFHKNSRVSEKVVEMP